VEFMVKSTFLMHRVELKVLFSASKKSHISKFLMHRVELKDIKPI